jgi:hypothetical protein
MRALPSTLLVVVCVAMAVTPTTRAAQEARSSSEPVAKLEDFHLAERRLLVDGAKNPELIPDEKIIAMFIGRTWLLPSEDDRAAERRLRNVTSRMKLSDADYQILRKELKRAYPELSARQSDRSTARDVRSFAAAQEATTASAMSVYERLLEFMSSDGRQKLREHISDAKKHARITEVAPRQR